MENNIASLHRGRQTLAIKNVGLHEREPLVRTRAGYELGHAGRQVVVADDLHACSEQTVDQVTADESGGAGHKSEATGLSYVVVHEGLSKLSKWSERADSATRPVVPPAPARQQASYCPSA